MIVGESDTIELAAPFERSGGFDGEDPSFHGPIP
jgi:hypothetical protein